MNPVQAFLAATSAAYFGCLVLTLYGKPALANMDRRVQAVFYFFACVVWGYVAFYPVSCVVYYALGVFYGFASIGSFIGYPQIWMAYWTSNPRGGSGAGQAFMSAWDLAIAVCCFMLV